MHHVHSALSGPDPEPPLEYLFEMNDGVDGPSGRRICQSQLSVPNGVRPGAVTTHRQKKEEFFDKRDAEVKVTGGGTAINDSKGAKAQQRRESPSYDRDTASRSDNEATRRLKVAVSNRLPRVDIVVEEKQKIQA